MPKKSTIKKWSTARQNRVFINQTAQHTEQLLSDVTIGEKTISLDPKKRAAVSRLIAQKILKKYTDASFVKNAAKYNANKSAKDIQTLKLIEEHVLSSERIGKLMKG